MRPFTISGLFGVRRRVGGAALVVVAMATMVLPSAAPIAVAGGARPAGPAAVVRLPTSRGTSARGGRIDKSVVMTSSSSSNTPPGGPLIASADPVLSPRAAISAEPRVPSRPAAATRADAAIATTTTLEVTPANPVAYPGQVHLHAIVVPIPQGSGGFLPAINFVVDGVLSRVAPVADDGTGDADISPSPGTHTVTAEFGGSGDYQPSTSAPATVTVVQKPDLATEQGSPALQSSQGFEIERRKPTIPVTSPSIAVGPTDMVTMTEREVRFMDRAGVRLFHLTPSEFFFFEPPTGQANDTPRSPQIVLDTLHDRWIATEVTHDAFFGKGHVYIFFSTTNDILASDWYIYRFDFTNWAPRNPSIGISSDKIAIGYDLATIDTSVELGSSQLVVDTAQLFAHPSVVNDMWFPPSAAVHTLRPALGKSAGNALQAVGWNSSTIPGHLVAVTATGTVTGGGVSFVQTDLAAGPTSLPDTGALPTTGPTNVIWKDNHLWFVSTRPCLPTGDIFDEACLRITELGTASGFTVEQDFVIAKSGYSNFLGGIELAGDGSVVIVYSQSSSGPSPAPNPISTWATVQAPGDPANSVRPSQLIANGATICGGPECTHASWNTTHLAVAFDPNDTHAVWQASAISIVSNWSAEATRLSLASTAPDGDFVLAGGRAETNALRLGVAPSPASTARATQILISDDPTTSAGLLVNAHPTPIDARIAWSLVDPTFGGTSTTGTRSVYLQWGDGTGNWSAVQHHEITIDTPLGADFVKLTPKRILDTRTGNGLSHPFVSHVPRTFQVTGRGGVPANAVAVTGILTMTGQTSGGFVFLGPTAGANPTSSTLNAPLGDTRANGVTVKLGPGGTLGAVFVTRKPTATTHLVFDVTGYLLADDPTAPLGSTYVAVDPVRALDTRLYGAGGRFQSHAPRTFCVTGCIPVPDDAIAVTGNLTVTKQSSGGYVFLGPTAPSFPTSSTLNFPKGDNRANNVTVALDSNGNLSAVFVGARATDSTDLIFDVTGYFVPGPWGATFIALDPDRILDTRDGTGLADPFATHVPRSFVVAGAVGVPTTGTVAVIGNVTLTRQTTGGYAFLGPTAPANPTSSTINVPLGDSRANGLDVGLAADGTLGAVWVGGVASTTDMIFDIVGYFR